MSLFDVAGSLSLRDIHENVCVGAGVIVVVCPDRS